MHAIVRNEELFQTALPGGRLLRKRLIPALIGVVLAFIPAGSVGGALAAGADALVGEWLVEDIGGGGVVDRVRMTVTFTGDGKVNGSGGCNRFTGKVKMTGDTLRFGLLATMRMACPPAVMGQEQKFLRTLQGVRSWAVDSDGKLVLRDDGGKPLLLLARVRQSAAITIEVPSTAAVRTVKVDYACGDRIVDATYFNAGEVSLVSLSWTGEFVVAANVLAASGAKYAGGRYIWWTKGKTADLYDLTKGENAEPLACTQT
ncbi:META domain-containing protein [Chelatococcus asaccharovorans]|uniref:Membrane-bound inhibitor of C-type lysozyme n=1 Tax=Chelatococcus asaccharovorans TaxID=28210 RepID=A0A2V3UB71_9HYPH|nr:META domain-containing protein [Chelatococcus asaccharovorans]PXW61764.1 membrane-bound inhibitor of C-type lysozyme [Chelatococcus asaccharovorans]